MRVAMGWGGVDGGRRGGDMALEQRAGGEMEGVRRLRGEKLALVLEEGGWNLNRNFVLPRRGEGAGLPKIFVSNFPACISTHAFSLHIKIFFIFRMIKVVFLSIYQTMRSWFKFDPLPAKST